MTAQLTLPSRLDLTAARSLARDIYASAGDLEVDASQVTHLGGLCLQVLLAAAHSCMADGRRFAIKDASADFDAAISLFGVDFSDITRTSGP